MTILIPRPISASAPASADWTSRSSESPEPALWVTASGKATLKPYSWRGWKTRPWAQRLFGMICDKSQEHAFVDWWIGSLAASRASRTQAQAGSDEVTTTATSSTPSASSLARWNRDTSSWRMCAASLPGMGLDDSLEDWPKSGSMRNGSVFERPMLERRTAESGCSSWPTAAARDYKGSSRIGARNRTSNALDEAAEQKWPTPTAGDSVRTPARNCTTDSGRHSGTTLTNAMADWAGPPDPEETGAGSPNGVGPHWATPQAMDSRDDAVHRSAATSTQSCLGRDLSRMGHDPKRLNPAFVEWLMGFPSWWSLPCDTAPTASDASATPSCPSRPNSLSESSSSD